MAHLEYKLVGGVLTPITMLDSTAQQIDDLVQTASLYSDAIVGLAEETYRISMQTEGQLPFKSVEMANVVSGPLYATNPGDYIEDGYANGLEPGRKYVISVTSADGSNKTGARTAIPSENYYAFVSFSGVNVFTPEAGGGLRIYNGTSGVISLSVSAADNTLIEPSKELPETTRDDAGKVLAVGSNGEILVGHKKADNLEFDTETSLLWLTSEGIRIGDGVKVATSGGGGGGGSENNAVLTLTNTSGYLAKTINYGSSCPFSFSWSSVEGGLETGPGVLKITVNSTLKATKQIEQGEHTIDLGEWLGVGENLVLVSVSDVYGNSRTLRPNINTVRLTLASSFNSNVPYTGSISFPYTPTGSAEKTVYFLVDGVQVGTESVTTSGRERTYTIPAQSHGCHQLEVYFTAEINGETVPSNHLYYAIGCYEEGNNTPIIVMDIRDLTVEQYEATAIPWWAYDPANLFANVTQHSADGDTPLTVNRTLQTWSYRPSTVGEEVISISCVGAASQTMAVISRKLIVTETNIKAEAETANMSLYLTSYGRSNSEENPAEWKYGDVSAVLTDFNFSSDGWLTDEDGLTVLRVGGDARVEIPLELFGTDFRSTGKTIEIEFASRSVLDYDAVLATCWAGNRGLQITAQQALLKSELSKVATRYKEDDHLRLSFVIEKSSGNRLIRSYINGIVSSMAQYSTNDHFTQGVPVGVSIGSNDCTIDIYNIRVYDNDLSRFQILDNWIADTRNLAERKDRYDRNNIFDDYGQILPTTLRPHQCYLVLNAPVLPQFKGDKKTCSGYYVDPVHRERSFTFKDAQIDVQGTSSQYYYVKNYKIKFKGGFILTDGTTVEVYAMNEDAVPTAEFTFKADVASSEGANNVVLAELYNDLCPVKTPAQEADPRVRQTIEGHPIVVFHDAGEGAYFLGKYNFNNDKGTPEVFGFTTGDESWEIRENGNALVSFKTDDFTGWETSFEARYPEDNKDITRLQAFVSWVASTNPDAVDTEEEKAARLEKFKTELSQWCSVDDAVFYYLFTLVFLCMDQREKNAFPTWIAAMRLWIWLFYDADSSLGTDNQGDLAYEYWMEDIDYTAGGDPVFNGQNNVFWRNMRTCFFDEIKAEYQRLRTELGSDGKRLLSYERVLEKFEAHQGQWSEAIYNEDAQRKGVEPLEKAGETTYLAMQQGKKEQHLKEFLYNRFRYMDSLFEIGSAMDDRMILRAHAQGNITMTSFINMYGQVYYNDEKAMHRMVRDTPTEFEWTAIGAEDAVIGINNAAMISDLGDLSPLMLEYADIGGATHLRKLKVGAGGDYVNHRLMRITLKNNTLLQELDARNCVALTGEQFPVDASGCTNIERIYLSGTNLTGITLPQGGILKVLHLPSTIANLTIIDQPKFEEFVMDGNDYSNITTLRLENVGGEMPALDILNAMAEGSFVRLIGFDWSFDDSADIELFAERISLMRGLDEYGGETALAQMSGIARVPKIAAGTLARLNKLYPSLTIIYDEISDYTYVKLLEGNLDNPYTNDRVTKIADNTFVYSDAKQNAALHYVFPNVTEVGSNVWAYSLSVNIIDLPKATSIGEWAFTYASWMTALILRNPDAVCTIADSRFAGTYFYVYVPSSRLEEYKSATNWSTISDRFRVLEDYTVDGTIYGELDKSKI